MVVLLSSLRLLCACRCYQLLLSKPLLALLKFEAGQLEVSTVPGVAGQMARVPIESSLLYLGPCLSYHGLPTFDGTVLAASWVDNLVSFGKSASDAIHILDALALHLKDNWGLEIKATSREYTTCQGGDRGHESTFAWQHVEHQYLLGHWISHDSGCHFDIAKTSSKAWGAF